MSQSAEKVDSAAPGGKTHRCGRCFAHVALSMGYCPECGAPMPNADPAASDAVVEQELSKANLLRVRKDFRAAEEQCLAVLRRLPNNISANVLLGDICYERGDFHQAAEWYELSLDLDPRSVPIQQKLVDARRLSDPGIDLTGLEAVGIAGPRTKLPGWAWAGILGFVLLLAYAAVMPKKPAVVEPKQSVIKTSVEAPLTSKTETPTKGTEPTTEPTRETPSSTGIAEDRELLQKLSQIPEIGSSFLEATVDPRTKHLHLTYLAAESLEAQAVRVARTVLSQGEEFERISLRAVKDGKGVFMADAERAKLPAADAADPAPEEFLSGIWLTATPPPSTP